MSGMIRWFKRPSIKKAKKPVLVKLPTDPKWYTVALKYSGTKEIPGKKSNEVISNFFKVVISKFLGDDIPWCAAFVGAVLEEAGYESTGSLMARSYLKYGRVITDPVRGDIVIISRGNPNGPHGHVTFFHSFDSKGNIRGFGGNQSDAVNISTYSINRLLGYRRPTELLDG